MNKDIKTQQKILDDFCKNFSEAQFRHILKQMISEGGFEAGVFKKKWKVCHHDWSVGKTFKMCKKCGENEKP